MPAGGLLDVGVVEDDHRRLAAELEVHPLEVGGGGRGDLHAGADRAGDRDHLRGLVLDQRAAGVAVAGDDVEHARRQELLGQLGRAASSDAGVVSRRLEHDRVAGGQRRGDLPDHHHQRVVPGRHLADHADRLAPDRTRCGRSCTRRPTGPRAPGRRRRRTGSGRCSAAAPRSWSGPSGLPVSFDSTCDELVGALLERVGDLEQRLLPLGGRGVAPGLEGRVGGGVRRGRRPRRPDIGACA